MKSNTKDLVITTFFTVFTGLFLSALLLFLLDLNPINVFSDAIKIMFSDKYNFADILVKATPLIFTALAFAFTYKANLFNIGAQGQFYAGAIVAISVSLSLQNVLPSLLVLVITLICAFVSGALVGALIGFLKANFGANEFLVSMMSTYLVQAVMNYLLRTFLKESKGEYPQSDAINASIRIPRVWEGTRLHAGIIIAVLAAIFVYILLYKTALGYRIRTVGMNASAAQMSGISIRKITIITFLISGGLAGMAGFTEVNGVQYMLIQNFNPTIGSAGLGIAILANAHPIGIIFASLLFGAIEVMGNIMGRMSGLNIPASFIQIMQGMVMVFVIISYFMRRKLADRRNKKKLMEAM